jgi:hypothetical protein
MKIYPDKAEKVQAKKVVQVKEAPKALQIIALLIAFVSVYYFFIKLLFL